MFFQPLYAGQTFGLGQISPLTALKLTDFVHEKSGYDKLDETDAPEVYHAIMDPDVSLAYMAAAIRKAIDDYRDIAGLDITKNPGITATLYNIGDSHEHAEELRNKIRRAGRTIWPRENYYGWLVNDKMSELQDLVDPDSGEEKGKQRASLAKE
ncbi:DUF1402 family protein [uncultured Cohaesibacter sp.]|uniref:DUF1402 family protein n=1 Tax=uncultured Cohaesibacter sp. TaxID=1002546 RepID=UPI00292E0D4C